MSTRQIHTLDVTGLMAFGDHLRGDVRAAFAATATARVYLASIDAELRALRSAPGAPAPEVEPPGDEALKAHGELGRAIWLGLSMVATTPNLPPETRAAAMRVRDAFGARPPSVRANVVTRIQRASEVRHALVARAEDLALLPPVLGDATFAAWIARWCETGSGFGGGLLASDIAEALGAPAPRPLRTVVGRLNGLIVRARRALRDELDADPSLPRTIEAEVFALYDHLVEEFRRRAAARRRKATAGQPPPADANGPAPADPAPAAPVPA